MKPAWDSAWPAKVWPRSTRKNPTVPARIAAIARSGEGRAHEIIFKHGAAMMSAVGMMIVTMRVALDLDAVVGRHHEKAVLDANDFDRRPIEARQHRPGDDVIDGPITAAPAR